MPAGHPDTPFLLPDVLFLFASLTPRFSAKQWPWPGVRRWSTPAIGRDQGRLRTNVNALTLRDARRFEFGIWTLVVEATLIAPSKR